MDIQGKRVLVVGSGKSGIGAARLLANVGAQPVLFDGNDKLDAEEIIEKAQMPDLKVLLGSVPEEIREEIALVIISPGVPVDAPMLEEYRKVQIPIWGEIELAYAFAKGKVAAITGTNGKTTTTTLVGQIMKEYYDSVYVVGNIGNPYTDIALETKEETVTVAEISSFQLETIHTFKPAVSAILNITPDHLNRHHTMECYVKTKEQIARNQTKDDICVLNYEDSYTRAFGDRCPAKAVFFSSKRELEEGIYLAAEEIYLAQKLPGGERTVQRLMHIHDMKLVGMCNVENVMAAIAICRGMQVPMEIILKTVREFKAVEHRIEYVATKNGVDYYNDSKGTNPDAAIQGIRAMDRPTVLIGGGYDKQSAYDEWIEAFDGKVKAFVLIGQTRDKIAACARAHGVTNIFMADTFEEAFELCVEQAVPGDAVLLSPACASWGMFPNYEVRGQVFKELVEKIGV
ncbi:MAG: UDP-N-acetylmuramoyl-L-alanine--D-glutamate ligase [Lachnospiraceae bacterium]|nr:UDP-N-acetylmuramoyl-L-alanine--D-glutamate ligase [Lachnospiraceae bacterium]GFI01828.1 UDP-N-acetylmuramoylalanine--D-glutamate ligase [Lachnospiraceae bacterium]